MIIQKATSVGKSIQN